MGQKRMSLFAATLTVALLLLAPGGVLLWNGEAAARLAKASLRSRPVTLLLMGTAMAWFLYKVTQLGEADFGAYKKPLFLFFFLIGVMSFYYVPDFLAVRGGAILILLLARPLLDAAFLEAPWSRLFMVAMVYVWIVTAIYFGAAPYRLRDFLGWLFQKPPRPRALGGFMAAYGLLLLGAAFTY